jgi:REP element-mobilizing transposase RayT
MRHDNFIPTPRYIRIRTRGRLPHWQVDEAVYFVTFRLKDSLPREVAINLKHEREHLLRNAVSSDRARLDRVFTQRLDHYLDLGIGSCLLREHGAIVAGALKHFDDQHYELHAWCVMPNHVHVMFSLERGEDLPKVLKSWKSFTAFRIGLGSIWQKEYFDRLIRSPQEFADTAAYIRVNPGRAGLRDWPWVG